MRAYALVMLCIGGLFLVLGAAICKGRTELIHAYHQGRVTDRAAYGRAFGRAVLALAAAPLLSAAIALRGGSARASLAAVAVLAAGTAAGVGLLAAVQKKYNRGF